MTDFLPRQETVPKGTRTDRLCLRPLTTAHVAIDYDAVMESREQLRAWSQTTWPKDDFTLAENRADLARHQREHSEGVAFTYTVLDPTETRCLGCVYITALPETIRHLYAAAAYAANVGFWVRTLELTEESAPEFGNGLESHLLVTLRQWFAADWPFDQVVYTISQQNPRQADLLDKARLLRRASVSLGDGRPCWVYDGSESL
jgi:hypothetical protein